MNVNPNDQPKWWFRRKASGYGWGLPSTWHGSTAFSAFLILICLGGPATFLGLGTSATILVIAGLVIVVAIKGEPLSSEFVDRQQLASLKTARSRT
jgi:hypothetical protein